MVLYDLVSTGYIYRDTYLFRSNSFSVQYCPLISNIPFVSIFLNKGADISPQPNHCGPSPLMCAVKRGRDSAVKYLLQQGSPIELRDFNHRTCLHVAVYSSEAETLKTLIQVRNFKRFDTNRPKDHVIA